MKFPNENPNTHSNLKGLPGWAWTGRRYGIERHLYLLQRITGLGVLLYLPMHLLVTSNKLNMSSWEATMALVNRLPALGEFLVFAGAVFHALNGIRLLLTHFGFLMRQPERPVYPFTVAALKQRWAVYSAFVITFVIVCYGGYELFIVAGH